MWLINKCSPEISLLKKDLSCVPVWVKLHDVALVAYTSDGLSLIASNIGTPMRLHSYTNNNMYLESLGRSSYAIALIEINASNEFHDNLVLVIPKLNGSGYNYSHRIRMGTP